MAWHLKMNYYAVYRTVLDYTQNLGKEKDKEVVFIYIIKTVC